MRIIDYFNIAAAVLNVFVVIAAVMIFKKNKGAAYHCTSKALDGSNNTPASCTFCMKRDAHSRLYAVGAIFFILFGALLRLYDLAGIPFGLQQDEASIGYEAYCLASFGIDRNGYHWPVYPITWGSGGGSPIMIYMNVITTKLFGSKVSSIRLVTAFLGVMTLVLFYAYLKKIKDSRTAFLGTAALCIMPWHIMISRFSLDSNTAPFFVMLATFVFLLGVRYGKTTIYALSATLYGLCLYSYGSANIVIPLFLIIICLYCIYMGRLSIRQLFISMACFIAVVIPLGIFYAVNFLGIPEIALSWISFPKFTSSHFGSVFIPFDSSFPERLASNLEGLARILTVGLNGEVSWNDMPSYATLYRFTFPVTFLGFIVMARGIRKGLKNREFSYNSIMMALLISSLLFALLVEQDMNRTVFLYLPLIYCFAMGLDFIFDAAGIAIASNSSSDTETLDTAGKTAVEYESSDKKSINTAGKAAVEYESSDKKSINAAGKAAVEYGSSGSNTSGSKRRNLKFAKKAALLPALISVLLLTAGFISFAKDYYGGYYNDYASCDFMPGYGEAMKRASDLTEDTKAAVYSTYTDVASPFMLTLYYTKYDPYDFMDTVVYKDPLAEFRVASSFGRFVFGLPNGDLTSSEYKKDVFVVTGNEIDMFPENEYTFEKYGNFTVVYSDK